MARAKFHPHRCNYKGIGIGPLKTKNFFLIFEQNVKYKRPPGAYPLRDFHNICRICTSFQDAFVSLDLLKGLWSYGGFNLTGSGYPQIFSAPSGETMHQTHKLFRGARTCSRSFITMPRLVGLRVHPPPGWRKTLSFCLSVTLLNVRVCTPDFAMKVLE